MEVHGRHVQDCSGELYRKSSVARERISLSGVRIGRPSGDGVERNELVASAALAAVMGTSSAPEIILFKRFRSRWQTIRQDQFEDSSTNSRVAEIVTNVKEDRGKFLMEALKEEQL